MNIRSWQKKQPLRRYQSVINTVFIEFSLCHRLTMSDNKFGFRSQTTNHLCTAIGDVFLSLFSLCVLQRQGINGSNLCFSSLRHHCKQKRNFSTQYMSVYVQTHLTFVYVSKQLSLLLFSLTYWCTEIITLFINYT